MSGSKRKHDNFLEHAPAEEYNAFAGDVPWGGQIKSVHVFLSLDDEKGIVAVDLTHRKPLTRIDAQMHFDVFQRAWGWCFRCSCGLLEVKDVLMCYDPS